MAIYTDSTNGGKRQGIKSDYIDPNKVWGWYHEGRDHSSNFRKESMRDCDYYDNQQWTAEKKQDLEDRGQPAIVINRIKPTIDLVIGTESKIRTDFKAAPRKNNGAFDAGIATECIKYVMDQNAGEYAISEIFEGQVKAGWDFVELCKSDDPFREIIQISTVPRHDLIWDPYAKEYDLGDGKYFIRAKWMELEDAENKFPKHKGLLKMAISTEELEPMYEMPYRGTEDQPDRPGVLQWPDAPISSPEWMDKSRKRVKLLECWYKCPKEVKLVDNYLTGEVEELDPSRIMEVLVTPGASIIQATIKKVRLCIVAGPHLLADSWSPYRHNEYPFIPWWCFKSDRKGEPYGLIRQMIDPQDEVNKRRSKAMHLLNARQIIATSNAIDKKENDWKQVASAVTDPEGVIKLDASAVNARFEIQSPIAMVEEQYKFEAEAKQEIEEAGVNREMMGQESNATSGRAIIARQVQGNTMLGKPFQNYRRSKQLLGQRIWSMIQQYWTRPKVLRITNKIATGLFGEFADTLPGERDHKFLELNMPIQYEGKVYVRNDISRAKVDITIDEQAFNATVRQTLLDEFSLMVSKLPPEIGILMLDDMIDLSDAPNKDRMIEKIKLVQGAMTQQLAMKQQNERMVAEATKQKAEVNAVNRTGEETAMTEGL